MKHKEAIKRIEYLKNKAEIALINNNTSCEWLKKDVEGTITAFSMAIEALEKQVPKKPSQDSIGLYYFPTCPNCHKWLEYDHHCECGQALDWSEQE